MIYRCRACRHEEERGCLSSASCCLYGFVLLVLSTGCLAGLARGIRSVLGDPPPAAEPADAPWWGDALAVAVGAGLTVAGMIVINLALQFAEWLVFVRRRPCPVCGARRWSRGFTEGFGL